MESNLTIPLSRHKRNEWKIVRNSKKNRPISSHSHSYHSLNNCTIQFENELKEHKEPKELKEPKANTEVYSTPMISKPFASQTYAAAVLPTLNMDSSESFNHKDYEYDRDDDVDFMEDIEVDEDNTDKITFGIGSRTDTRTGSGIKTVSSGAGAGTGMEESNNVKNAESSAASVGSAMGSVASSTTIYCNNCGEAGHLFKNCSKPIISCGVIVYRKDYDGTRRYLMIQRKDTFGFIDFLRGRYLISNKNQIIGLIDEMTLKEKSMILSDDFKKMWAYMWGSSHFVYGMEEHRAEEKLQQLRRGVSFDGESYCLRELIEASSTAWETPEWGFPKGRRNLHEKNLQTALREFSEETGFPQNSIEIITNIVPYDELLMGSNFKAYRHIYFVGQMSSLDYYDPTKFQKSEVRRIGWKTIEECISLIRPYSTEKINLIVRIDRVLSSNTIIS